MVELRRPLGLALSAGGCLGAWQAGALLGLEGSGLGFDRVMGVSAGALNGAGWALGLGGELAERWRRVDRSLLRFSPRCFPPSLFSDRPLREALEFCADDGSARRRLRCPLTVVAAHADRKRRAYAAFEPEGRWEGPLLSRLLASCAIPVVFPGVALGADGDGGRHIDGSVPCEEPFRFEGLEGCADVLVIETVRHDELDRRPRGLFDELDLRARKTIRSLMSQGVAGLRAAARPPRVFRLSPSRPLDFSMLSFSARNAEAGLAQGRADAESFLKNPRTAA